MRTIAIFLLFGASVAFAQSAAPAPPAGTVPPAASPAAPAPPPEVDAALRDRVTKFYQAQVDRKYRRADDYVAEDTKDYFYTMQKAPLLKFDIMKISYSDNFTKAKVWMSFERNLVQPMFPTMKLNSREETNWKIEDGLWSWWTDATVMQTPFGEMRFPKTLPGGTVPGAVAPKIPAVKDLTSPVAADKSEVELGARKSDQVVLRNSLPGTITLSLEAPETPGLEMKLDRTEVAANSDARILLTYDPAAAGAKGAQTVTLNVVVQPTNQIIPIQVTLKPPAAK